ncbi:MAG TPA: phosphatase PAP2 family protein [Bauldia sp.]|nr:phosphatase PAP2 family protein [Bauldia sp.]
MADGNRVSLSANIGAAWTRLTRGLPRSGRPRRHGWTIAVVLGAAALVGLAMLFLDERSIAWAKGLAPGDAFFFQSITGFGRSAWPLVPSGVVLALLAVGDWTRVPRRIAAAWAEFGALLGAFFLAVAGAGLLTDVIKWSIGRSRPVLFWTDGTLTFTPASFDYAHVSFPSGHATTVAAVALFAWLVLRVWSLPVVAVCIAIAVSRVAVGAHYPSDVVAGVIVGLLFTGLLIAALARRRIAFSVGPGGIRPRATALRPLLLSRAGRRRLVGGLALAFRLTEPRRTTLRGRR